MKLRRFAGIVAVLVILAGPMGLLGADHAAFHRDCSTSSSGRVPCPICHFLSTTSVEAPAPGLTLPGLVSYGNVEAALPSLVLPVPPASPARSRAPPALS